MARIHCTGVAALVQAASRWQRVGCKVSFIEYESKQLRAISSSRAEKPTMGALLPVNRIAKRRGPTRIRCTGVAAFVQVETGRQGSMLWIFSQPKKNRAPHRKRTERTPATTRRFSTEPSIQESILADVRRGAQKNLTTGIKVLLLFSQGVGGKVHLLDIFAAKK